MTKTICVPLDEHETMSAISDLLANHRMIALIWSIDDVKSRCPDLDYEQCWKVLQQCERDHDANYGITWDTIEQTADDLFGRTAAK